MHQDVVLRGPSADLGEGQDGQTMWRGTREDLCCDQQVTARVNLLRHGQQEGHSRRIETETAAAPTVD